MADTPNRNYPLPDPEENVSDDVYRLISSFTMIDTDIAAAFAAISGKAATVHTHAMSSITGLVDALAGKSATNHTHAIDDLSDVSGMAAAPNGYIMWKQAGAWVPVAPLSVLGTHDHTIGQVTGLTAALNSKLDDAALASASAKGTPVDADTVPLTDSAASGARKSLSWSAIKATLKTYFDTLYTAAGLGVQTGTILDFAGTAAPTGYLLCAGQEVLRTTYAALDAVITTTYGAYTNGSGGVGTTHFRLPDLRGRVVAGKDDMGGAPASRLTSGGSGLVGNGIGNVGGAETHTLTTSQMPTHTHTIQAIGSRNLASGGGDVVAEQGSNSSMDTGQAGSGSAHNNVQPTMILNKIIKT